MFNKIHRPAWFPRAYQRRVEWLELAVRRGYIAAERANSLEARMASAGGQNNRRAFTRVCHEIDGVRRKIEKGGG